MTRARVAAAAILALTPAAVGASGGRGFIELRLQGYSGVEGQPVQTVQRLRPELSTALSDRFSLTAAVELGLSQGRSFQNEWRETLRASALGPVLEAAQCAWPEEEDYQHVHNTDDQARDVVRRVRRGAPPMTPARDSYETMRVCEAVEQSADTGAIVELADDRAGELNKKAKKEGGAGAKT